MKGKRPDPNDCQNNFSASLSSSAFALGLSYLLSSILKRFSWVNKIFCDLNPTLRKSTRDFELNRKNKPKNRSGS